MPLAQQWEKLLLQSMAAGGAYRFTPRNSSNALSAGSRIGRRAGNSLEFLEHREYRPGDDLRLVDWNVYARSNSWVVKRFQEEITPILDLIVDGSVSMLMPDSAKAKAALALAAFLSEAAASSALSSRLHILKAIPETVAKDRRSPGEWLPFEFDARVSPPVLFRQLAPLLRNEGIRLFLSDLFFPDEPAALLRQLATSCSAVVVIQIASRTDFLPPMEGNLRLIDSESDEELEMRLADEEMKHYKERLRRHLCSYQDACRSLGINMVSVIAEDFLETFRVDPFIHCGLLQHQ